MIAISRGTFGGGKAVAELLAERLGWHCVSREMVIADAAERYGLDKEGMLAATNELPGGQSISAEKKMTHIRYIRAAILARAAKGAMVYHGHGGHLLLQGIPGLLRVRINAGLNYRVEYAMRSGQIDREEAVALIEAIDRRRMRWSMEVWGVRWDDPSLYDLVLCLDKMTVDTAARVIATASSQPEYAEGPELQRLLADELVKARVWAALEQNPQTRSLRVEIAAEEGAVLISGDVGSNKLVEAIVSTARETEGVRAVSHRLSVGASWFW